MRHSSAGLLAWGALALSGCASSPGRGIVPAEGGEDAAPVPPVDGPPALAPDAPGPAPDVGRGPAPDAGPADAAAAGPEVRADAIARESDAAPPASDLGKALATRPETWARLTGFPEGPSWRPDGSVLLCAPTLVRVAPDRKRFRMLSFRCLGSVVLLDGSVLVTGEAGLYHVRGDGSVALLAQAPGANDLSVDGAGHVYFTAGGGVHRLSPSGKHDVIATGIGANGIEVDPASRFVYVAQPGANQVSRFEVPPDGGVPGRPAPYLTGVPTPDGLAFDAAGHLWAALHRDRKIGVYDVRTRRELGRLDVPVETTVQNLAFGGARNDVLFVVGGNYSANAVLLRYELGVPGYRPNPPAAAYRPLRLLEEKVNETAF